MTKNVANEASLAPTAPSRRREPLLKAMSKLDAAGINCGKCVGTCCTVAANSMQISPLEALDIALFLRQLPAAEAETLKLRIMHAVQKFGLDRPVPGDGQRALLRRYYTCPFYGDEQSTAPGCALPIVVKPYGCLAFNPRRAGLTSGGDCAGLNVGARVNDDEAQRIRELHAAFEGAERLPVPTAVLVALSW